MRIFVLKFVISISGLLISIFSAIPICNIFLNHQIGSFDLDDLFLSNYYFIIWNMFSGLILFTIVSPMIFGKIIRSLIFNIFIFSQLIVFAVFSEELSIAFRTLTIALPNIFAVGFVLKWNFDSRSAHSKEH